MFYIINIYNFMSIKKKCHYHSLVTIHLKVFLPILDECLLDYKAQEVCL